jgi:Peptidase family M28
MRSSLLVATACAATVAGIAVIILTEPTHAAAAAAPHLTSPLRQVDSAAMIRTLVSRLELDNYKATIKGLTKFGDRREGSQRNRDAVDWIEAQLESYGCTNTERITYEAASRGGGGGNRGGRAGRGGDSTAARGGGGARGGRASDTTAGRGARGGRGGDSTAVAARGGRAGGGRGGGGRGIPGVPSDTPRPGAGGKGFGGPTGVNSDPMRQPNEELRALDMQPVLPDPRQEVYCTKVGTTHPEEMYILGGHMDGIGYGEAANDDGSGAALVMELARIFSSPDVQTARSIRFILWNGEEGGLNGSRAYVAQRRELQGIENPKGSGKYPEPKWLGMVQHDMMMWDHGAPRADGTVSREQRPEADVNIEWQQNSQMATDAEMLAWFFRQANYTYATDYPATVGNKMSNTDSQSFQDYTPAISLRENERTDHIGFGWDPNWHQPTDVFTTYYDKDFMLGLNAAQTTLAAIARLTGATVK